MPCDCVHFSRIFFLDSLKKKRLQIENPFDIFFFIPASLPISISLSPCLSDSLPSPSLSHLSHLSRIHSHEFHYVEIYLRLS